MPRGSVPRGGPVASFLPECEPSGGRAVDPVASSHVADKKHEKHQEGKQEQVFQTLGLEDVDVGVRFHDLLPYTPGAVSCGRLKTGIRLTTQRKTQICTKTIINVTTYS